MPLILPSPKYPREARVKEVLEQADRENLKANQDNFLGDGSIILTSSGGLLYRLVVNDAGALSTEVVANPRS